MFIEFYRCLSSIDAAQWGHHFLGNLIDAPILHRDWTLTFACQGFQPLYMRRAIRFWLSHCRQRSPENWGARPRWGSYTGSLPGYFPWMHCVSGGQSMSKPLELPSIDICHIYIYVIYIYMYIYIIRYEYYIYIYITHYAPINPRDLTDLNWWVSCYTLWSAGEWSRDRCSQNGTLDRSNAEALPGVLIIDLPANRKKTTRKWKKIGW